MKPSLWSKWVRCVLLRPPTPRRGMRPSLEVLEDRTVPAVFNVAAGATLDLIVDINTANKNGESNVINLAAGSTYDLGFVNNDWYGPNGLPAITSDLTIHGNGATIERDPAAGTPDLRLFYVSGGLELPAGSLTMDNVTLANGIARGGDSKEGGGGLGAGGAIFNQGTLKLTDVTLTNNSAVGGSSGVSSAGNGGGGMGQDAPATGDGGGFGAETGLGGQGGAGGAGGGGGGGGFLAGDNGQPGPATAGRGGKGGGRGSFGGGGNLGATSDGGDGGSDQVGSAGGNFGDGGHNGGGGGVGGGGGGCGLAGISGLTSIAGDGGFGGGGGGGTQAGGDGGFGGGGGASLDNFNVGFGGYGGGASTRGTGAIGGGGAGMGGAIFNMGADSARPGSGRATLINCTLTGNTAQGGDATNPGEGLGGAIFNLDGTVTLTNDTVDANHATNGGAVCNLAFGHDIDTGFAVAASLVLNNSILANSVLPPGRMFPNVDLLSTNDGSNNTATVTGSHNLVTSSRGTLGAGVIALTTDPRLGPLQNNGGLTPTMLPQSGSPVLGAGDSSLAPPTDQRGQPRTTKAPIDLGSVQLSFAQSPPSSPPGSPPGSPPSPPPSLLQALITLYIDGIEMEAFSQATLASIRSTPQSLDIATELGHLLQFFGSPSPNAIQASIAFNEPFAGPFGPLVVMAGEHAVDQALQQSSASS